MVHLTVGLGEVGSAIHKIVGGVYTTRGKSTWHEEYVDVVHICIPYSKSFAKTVFYYKMFSPLIIVHSSVPVGTCDKLGVTHSPIAGVHPHLEKGIRTFVKYFGGKNAKKAARIFDQLNIPTHTFKDARTTEAMKLWSTTQYGRMIMLEKEIYLWCKVNKLNFNDVYTRSNIDYNQGYIKLGRPEVVRPYLKHIDGPIGGHCVLPNAKLLKVKV